MSERHSLILSPPPAHRAEASPRTVRWSIVVPCYRSGAWLADLVLRIEAAAGDRLPDLELLLVDDASPDDVTWHAIEKCAAEHSWVRGIGLQFNVGQFRALVAGLEHARGEWVVTMDDDFQTPPEELTKLFDAADRHPEMDAIIGCYARKHHSRFRNLGTGLVSFVLKHVYDKPSELRTTSFRILKRPLVAALCAHTTREPVISALILRSTRRLMNVEVDHAPRAHGRSGYTLGRLVEIVVAKIFSRSTAPLRAVSVLGLLVALGSAAFGLYSLVKWWRGIIIEPGFTTIVLLITALCGVTLLAIGVIGEYLIRVVVEVSGAPRYVVRAEAGERCREAESWTRS